MKHKDIIRLNENLTKVTGLVGFKVNYAIQKNLAKFKPEISILDEQKLPLFEVVKDYNKKFGELISSLQYVTLKPNGTYDIPRDKMPEWEALHNPIKEKYKEELDTFNKSIKDYEKFLSETDSTVELWKVKQADVPVDITTEQMNLIFDIIEE